jgi:hypothetical protein
MQVRKREERGWAASAAGPGQERVKRSFSFSFF